MSKSRDIADSAETINYIDTVTSNVQDQIDNLDPLPSQTGNAGNFLTTDGTNASWGVPASGFSSVDVLTSGTSWSVPSGITLVKITAIGGGGSGGTTAVASRGCGGAGGGGASIKYLAVTSGATISITVGAGAAAPTEGTYANGFNGGTTTVVYAGSTVASATGGTGGAQAGNAGQGGIGSSGDINFGGTAGTSSMNAYLASGSGGASFMGGGGRGSFNDSEHDGLVYGGGGAGAFGTGVAGAGASGAVIIEY